jgi:hypothetical protein
MKSKLRDANEATELSGITGFAFSAFSLDRL